MLFSSKRFDESIGLSYFGARYYDAFIGRFISRDPLGYIDGPNGYIYVANNPLGFIDPFGLWTFQIGYFVSSFFLTFGVSFEAGIVFGYSKEQGFQVGGYFSNADGQGFGLGGSHGLAVRLQKEWDKTAEILRESFAPCYS